MKKVMLNILLALLTISGSALASNLKESINTFSTKIFNLAHNRKQNIVISPYSIYLAFSPVYEGAKSNTEEKLKKCFFYPEKKKLRKLVKKELTEKEKSGNFKLFNGIYIQKNFKLQCDFLKIVRDFYKTKIKQVDFTSPAGRKKAVYAINQNVEKLTEGKIKELLKEKDINQLTRLIIVNAIHFKDLWLIPFNEKLTTEKPFFTPEKEIKVPTMETTGRFKTFENETVKAISLPYKNHYKMNIFIPKTQSFKPEYRIFKEIEKQLKLRFVKVEMPKFKIKNRIYLKKLLSKMGIKKLFTPEADLSGMTGKRNLYVQKAVHQTFINVDEKGTEATAATAVVIGIKSLIPKTPEPFKINKPFFFTITDTKGTILFIGHISNPLEEYR